MSEKIILFPGYEPEPLLTQLQNVPEDILQQYVQQVERQVDRLLAWRNITSAKDNKRIFERLFQETLNEDDKHSFEQLVAALVSQDVMQRINEIAELTFYVAFPSEETFKKAMELISLVKSLDIDFRQTALSCRRLSLQASFLSDICSILKEKKTSLEGPLHERLAVVAEKELDELGALVVKTLQEVV